MRAPVVIIGEVTNIRLYGKQHGDHFPPPMAPWVRTLYWCQGDFQSIAVVRGHLPSSRRYLWATGLKGCKLYEDNPESIRSRYETRAWFLREEGEFLRPVDDYGTRHFVGLCARWRDGPALPPAKRLGAMLLDPPANCATPSDYHQWLWEVADMACDLLGRTECVSRIRALQDVDPRLRVIGCEYLKAQQQIICPQ